MRKMTESKGKWSEFKFEAKILLHKATMIIQGFFLNNQVNIIDRENDRTGKIYTESTSNVTFCFLPAQ